MNYVYPSTEVIKKMVERGFGSELDISDVYHKGMTMRQYYKAAALTGLLANSYAGESRPLSTGTFGEHVDMAAVYADIMIKGNGEYERNT